MTGSAGAHDRATQGEAAGFRREGFFKRFGFEASRAAEFPLIVGEEFDENSSMSVAGSCS